MLNMLHKIVVGQRATRILLQKLLSVSFTSQSCCLRSVLGHELSCPLVECLSIRPVLFRLHVHHCNVNIVFLSLMVIYIQWRLQAGRLDLVLPEDCRFLSELRGFNVNPSCHWLGLTIIHFGGRFPLFRLEKTDADTNNM